MSRRRATFRLHHHNWVVFLHTFTITREPSLILIRRRRRVLRITHLTRPFTTALIRLVITEDEEAGTGAGEDDMDQPQHRPIMVRGTSAL